MRSIAPGFREAPFEMCWFYMGSAQIALDPPSVKRANVEKVPQTIMASLYNPPMPIWKQHISKRGFPYFYF